MNDLELHYYIDEGKHSMDAFVKNRAEHELLHLITEVSALLDIDISVEIEAMEQGGIKEIIKFFSKNKNKAYLGIFVFFATILGNVVTSVVSDAINNDRELVELTKEEKKLNIIKLKQEISQNNSKDTSVLVNRIVEIINSDFKVRVFKSRFYYQIYKEDNIYMLSLTELKKNREITDVNYSINREDFKKQILDEERSPIITVENANIEVISPVLKASEMKWRGVYNGKAITFELKDSEFKNAVLNKQYSFSNGTSMRCTLKYREGINDNGVPCFKEIIVYDVLEVLDGSIALQTDKYKRKKASSNQTKLPL